MSNERDQQLEALQTKVGELEQAVREALKTREMLSNLRAVLSHLIVGMEAVPEFARLQLGARHSPQYAPFASSLAEAKELMKSNTSPEP